MRYRTPAIGRGLRLFREGREQKSKDFAKILGISPSYYSEIESGRRPLGAEAAEKLAGAMGMEEPAFRRLLLQLAGADETRREVVEAAMTGSAGRIPDEALQLREDVSVYRPLNPMTSNTPDNAGLNRELVALLPREEVFRLLNQLTAAGEGGDHAALRKARALMDVIPMPDPAQAGG